MKKSILPRLFAPLHQFAHSARSVLALLALLVAVPSAGWGFTPGTFNPPVSGLFTAITASPTPIAATGGGFTFTFFTTGAGFGALNQPSLSRINFLCSSTPNASFVTGGYVSIKSDDGTPFKMMSLRMVAGTFQWANPNTVTMTGYRSGSVVSGATATKSDFPTDATDTSYPWDVSAVTGFNSVDEIRLTTNYAGGSPAGRLSLYQVVTQAAVSPSPTVTSSSANLASDATTLTITGTNFDVATPGNNTVAFTPSGTGTVTAATSTSLTVTGLSGLTAGALNAVVTNGSGNSGAAVQVATVVAVVTQLGAEQSQYATAVSGVATMTGYNIPAGSNRLFVVTASSPGFTNVASVTAAGVELIRAVQGNDTVASDSIWYAAFGTAAVPTPVNIVAKFNGTAGGSTDAFISAVTFSNVDQSTPVTDPHFFAANSGNNSTNVVSTSTSDKVFDIFDTYGSPTPILTPGGGQTVVSTKSGAISNGGFAAYATSRKVGAAGTVAVSWSSGATSLIQEAINIKFGTTAAPVATTTAASSITGTTATLNGTANASGNTSTPVYFEYGTTATYEITNSVLGAATPSTVSGSSNASVSKNITGLTPGTTYHYRVVVGGILGNDLTFVATAAIPTIIVSPSSVALGTTTAGTASTPAQSFTVSGSNLTADVVITPPANVELSKDSGSTWQTSQTLTQSGGSVGNTTIQARIPASAVATTAQVSVTGNITVASTGATTQNVSVTGTVNPIPVLTILPTSQTLANNANTTAVSFSSTVTGTTYTWTNDNTTVGIGASGSGSVISSFTGTNTGNTPVTATFTVTPTANSVVGVAKTFTITVNPTPVLTITPTSQTVANGANTTAVSFSSTVVGTTYTWTNNNTSIGIGASGSGSSIASFTATNTGTTPVTATFTVTPTANSAVGVAKTFTITVNPAIPVVTLTTTAVNANATTLTITGTGFDPTAANNTIAFTPTGTGTVTAATSTSLTVSVSGLRAGALNAVVTTGAGNSGSPVQVATVKPVITSNSANLLSTATTLTINGFGFDPTAANNTVAFSPAGTGTVTASTATSLTVTGITGLTGGALNAIVTSNSQASTSAQVATVSVVPSLSINDVSANEGNSGNSTFTFTVSLSSPALAGGVTFDIAAASNTASNGSDYLPASQNGVVIPQGSSSATFDVTVKGDFTVEPNETFFVNVTNVVGATVTDAQGLGTILNDDAAPTVTLTTTSVNANAASLTITGTGFDTTAANNTVAFTPTGTGTVTAATATSLTVSVSGLRAGALNAVVTTGSGNSGAAVQVATVKPVITSNTGNLLTTATTMTINGFGFDLTAGNNTVAFSPAGTGTVTASTATSLTVSSITGLTPGALNAVVTSNSQASASTQVATVVPPPPTVSAITPALGTSSGSTQVTITGTNFVAGATVTIGGGSAALVSVVNATTITCVTPPGAAGAPVSVVVTTSGGANTANSLYTYVTPGSYRVYNLNLNGPSESPPNASPGIGSGTVILDTIAKTMTINAFFSGLTGNTTAAHIHSATAVPFTATAGVATTTPTFPGFPSGVTAGTFTATYDMTLAGSYNPAYVTANGGTPASAFTAFAADCDSGKAYFNIHSSTFSAGEIRSFLIAAPPAPEINVRGNGVSIADGDSTPSTADHTDFGTANIGLTTVVRTFTVENVGSLNLNLTGAPNKVVVGGANAADFSVTTVPTSPITPAGSTTFQVTFTPGGKGTRNATLSIDNNDGDENPHNFSIRGTGVDVTPPVISGTPLNTPCIEATSAAGAVATYASPTALDNVDGPVPVTCVLASGSTFPVGTNTVTCTATDSSFNSASTSFTVQVCDTTPPTISGTPSNIVGVIATSVAGAVVTFASPTANDIVDGPRTVTCSPASGSTFAIGTTTVVCTATDSHSNFATTSFTVNVVNPAPLPVTTSTGGQIGSGEPAGNGSGAAGIGTWDTLRTGAVLAANGDIAFRANLLVGSGTPSVTNQDFQGIWEDNGTTTALKARAGSAAPGTGGAAWDQLPTNPWLASNGRMTFGGLTRIGTGSPAVTSASDGGLWSELGDGTLKQLLREIQAVPGIPAFVVDLLPQTTVASSTVGNSAFTIRLRNGPTRTTALVRADVSGGGVVTLASVATQGGAAPAIGGGTLGTFYVLNGNFTDPRMNDAGNIAFAATLNTGGGVTGANDTQGIWFQTNAASALAAVARAGSIAPGTSGAKFTAFERPTIADGGAVAFRGFIDATGDNTLNDKSQGIWASPNGTAASLVPVIRTGDTGISGMPVGSTVASVWSPFSSKSGKIAFRASIIDGGIEKRAIFTNNSGTMKMLYMVGSAAPDLAGETFDNFDHPVIGDSGHLAFTASTNAGKFGIWKEIVAANNTPALLMKVGDNVTTSQGVKSVASLSVPGTGTTDRIYEQEVIDAAGEMLVFVTYGDASQGILLSP